MINKVYIVMGSYSYYSDHDEWIVTGYTEEDMANIHAEKAQQVIKDYIKAGDFTAKLSNPYDGYLTNNGWLEQTSYDVIEFDLFLHLDQFQESVGL